MRSARALRQHDETRPAQALGLSLVAAAGFSTLPVAAHLFAGDANSFMYAATLTASAVVAAGLYLVVCGHPLLSLIAKVVRAVSAMRQQGIRGHATLALLAAAMTNHGLFVVAAHHAGIVAATVLYQLWPLSAAVLLAESRGPRSRRLRGSTAALMTAAFVVTAVAVASQSAGAGSEGIWWLGVASGAAAGVLGGAVVSETAVIGYHAGRCAGPGDGSDAGEAVAVMMAALMACTAAAVVINTALAAVTGGFAHGLRPSTVFGAALAGFAITAGAVAARVALVRCSGLGIVAVQGLDIVLALVWLALAGAGFQHGWMFAGCVALLAAVNTLIQAGDAGRRASQPEHGS